MDVQGYMSPHRPEDSQGQHYAQMSLTPTMAKTQPLPSLQSLALHGACKQHVNSSVGNNKEQQQQPLSLADPPSSAYASSLRKPMHAMQTIRSSAMSKRKSSPAILGVPLGLNDEVQAQLSLHLSRQRNSIEAAMLLANLNRLPSSSHAVAAAAAAAAVANHCQSNLLVDDSDDHNNNKSWPDDDYLAPSPSVTFPRQRRHSHDVTMSWATMPASFLERSSFYHDAASSSGPSSSPASPTTAADSRSLVVQSYHHQPLQQQQGSGQQATKVSWFHGDPSEPSHHQYYAKTEKLPPMLHHQHESREHHLPGSQHHSPAYHGMYMSAPPPPPPPPSGPHASALHPLAQSDVTSGQKRDLMDEPLPSPPPHSNNNYYYPYPPPPPPLHYSGGAQPPALPPMHTHQGPQHQQMAYFYHPGKLPVLSPMDGMMYPASQNEGPPPPGGAVPLGGTPLSRTSSTNSTKRRKNRADADEDDMANAVNPGDPDFPDMPLSDIDAARVDPEARPRRQKLRYPGDKYTPQWVRYNGQAKEGLCDTCQPGKWLQLKNSAFWYHKQFFHGISSVSGKEFMQPLETRWVDHDLVEGLCHQCHQWVSVSNIKRKNSVLWYRHAHKCHVYHKPKPNVLKRR